MSTAEKMQKDPRMQRVQDLMKSYPDFPKPGVLFRDIFPVLHDPAAFSDLIDVFVEEIKAEYPNVDIIMGLESRGFLLGVPVALKLKLPFVPVRKAGKLPGEKYSVSFSLEYGKDAFEIQKSALSTGQNVIIIDDLLATGGSMSAACELVNLAGAKVLKCFVLVELVGLEGHKKLSVPFTPLLQF